MLHRASQRVSELIEEIFNAASDLAPEGRAAYLDARLDASNRSDQIVREEVERLLLHYERTGILDKSLLESTAWEERAAPALQPGEMLNDRFLVLRMIGAGGMGEVYEAEDLRISQTVALKTIRADMAGDDAQAVRFRRELLISRNLAHRNVCKVFDYDEISRGRAGQLRFFTMELLRGETLAQRLANRGRLAPDTALSILEQVAAGLEEVHRCGIIHRDLKPSNIFLVTEPDGRERAVVMDFGLARDLTDDEVRQTRTGMVMGTRLYMAPELPKTVGVFNDVYSFAVVALEMVTGSPTPIVAPRSVVPALDPSWDKALLACFSLDTARRPSSALEVVSLLRRRTRAWRRAGIAAVAAVLCVSAMTLAWSRINPAPTPAPSTTQITFDSGLTLDAASSPDGKLLAYASDRNSTGDLNIWLQNMVTGETSQITHDPGDEDEPSISPDGTLVAWHSRGDDSVHVRAIATSDGAAVEVTKHGVDPLFSPDGKHLLYWTGLEGEPDAAGRIWTVPVFGNPLSVGNPINLARGCADARLPTWSPDSESVLFRGSCAPSLPGEKQDWWITPLEGGSTKPTGIGPRLRASGMTAHESKVLWNGNVPWNASVVIFAAQAGQANHLWSIELFPLLRFPIGAPRPITSGAGFQDIPAIISGGRIAFTELREQIHLFRIDLASGDLVRVTNQQSLDTSVSCSSDGQTLAFGRRLGSARNVWVKDLRTGKERELASVEVTRMQQASKELAVPFLSPDGRTVAVSLGSSIQLIDVPTEHMATVCSDCGELRGWLPGKQALLYLERRPGLSQSLKVLDLNTRTKKTLLSASGLNEAVVSPDGNTLAFTIRGDAVHSTIFIAKLTSNGVVGAPTPVTLDGQWADKPAWSPDGKVIYFAAKIDGFQCIWRQNIDRQLLRTRGVPQPVRHFHQAVASLFGLKASSANLAVANGGVYLSVDLPQGNIWAVQP